LIDSLTHSFPHSFTVLPINIEYDLETGIIIKIWKPEV